MSKPASGPNMTLLFGIVPLSRRFARPVAAEAETKEGSGAVRYRRWSDTSSNEPRGRLAHESADGKEIIGTNASGEQTRLRDALCRTRGYGRSVRMLHVGPLNTECLSSCLPKAVSASGRSDLKLNLSRGG